MQTENLSFTLESAIEKFQSTLKEYALPLFESLSDGLQKEYVEPILGRATIIEPELTQLYSWKNGIKESLALHILKYNQLSFGKLMPFGFAVSTYVLNKVEPSWKKHLFPIITTNAGDYLLYDTNKKSKTYKMILLYSAELLVVEPEVAYDSLAHLFDTVSECYFTGIYRFDSQENLLEIDDQAEFLLSAERYPKSKYWQE